jgi:hypothetical protein
MQKPTGSGSTFKQPSYISSSLSPLINSGKDKVPNNFSQLDALYKGKLNSLSGNTKIILPVNAPMKPVTISVPQDYVMKESGIQ